MIHTSNFTLIIYNSIYPLRTMSAFTTLFSSFLFLFTDTHTHTLLDNKIISLTGILLAVCTILFVLRSTLVTFQSEKQLSITKVNLSGVVPRVFGEESSVI